MRKAGNRMQLATPLAVSQREECAGKQATIRCKTPPAPQNRMSEETVILLVDIAVILLLFRLENCSTLVSQGPLHACPASTNW